MAAFGRQCPQETAAAGYCPRRLRQQTTRCRGARRAWKSSSGCVFRPDESRGYSATVVTHTYEPSGRGRVRHLQECKCYLWEHYRYHQWRH